MTQIMNESNKKKYIMKKTTFYREKQINQKWKKKEREKEKKMTRGNIKKEQRKWRE